MLSPASPPHGQPQCLRATVYSSTAVVSRRARSTQHDTMEESKTRTVSSLKSEDSTERLICTTPRGGRQLGRAAIAALAAAQVLAGALLMSAGATALLRGANMSRAGGGLWAGSAGLLLGLVGLLAALTDKHDAHRASPALTTFVALSVASVASSSSAALLAATGVKRDLLLAAQQQPSDHSFQEEMAAWNPVLANIAVLSLSCIHWLLSVATVALLARRVCHCFSPGDPTRATTKQPSDKQPEHKETPGKIDKRELCGQLEGKLTDTEGKTSYGSAGSKERLVSRWLGGHPVPVLPPGGHPRPRPPRGPPVVLLPAHNTLQPAARVRMLVPPHYATLPPPARLYPRGYLRPPPALYYPPHDTRGRRRRRAVGSRAVRRAAVGTAGRQTQLTRSLERIHRKREKPSDNDLRQTYTGLDRTYADQYIAVCDESRSHAAADTSPSLTSVGTESRVRRDSF